VIIDDFPTPKGGYERPNNIALFYKKTSQERGHTWKKATRGGGAGTRLVITG
jgi:hypothetical protein